MGGNETTYHRRIMSDRQTDVDAFEGIPSPVSLVVPCRAEHVALCRLVVGAVANRDGLDEDAVADLKVIVTEACNCFLALAGSAPTSAGGPTGANAPTGGCSLRMEFDSQPEEFVISVLYPEKRDLVPWLERCDAMSDAGLGLTMLRALTDEMVEQASDDGTVLRLTKRV
jgi:anti-sigma regulatory factor (Ser/Thr protein kinase)